MGKETEIAWTDSTWNPWWGCQRVSPGCENCYAETFAHRLGLKVWGPQSSRRTFGEKHWAEPLKWNRDAVKAGKRHRVFCSSMADVFEDRRELDAERAKLWPLIEATPALDWLLLTKRPENMTRLAPAHWAARWPANVWAGTTVESQDYAVRRLPHLLRVPAAIRFLSCEPLLGPLDLVEAIGIAMLDADMLEGNDFGIHWVIVGGESGAGSRPYDPQWARDIIEQCRHAQVACFHKQLGAKPVGMAMKDKKGGDWSEWPADLRVREWPDRARAGQSGEGVAR